MNTKKHILVAVPTMGRVHTFLTSTLIEWGRKYNGPDVFVHFYFGYHVSFVDRARNQIAELFLNKTLPTGEKFTHLLFIDSDTLPEADALDRLLAADKDVVSGLTPILRFADPNDWEMYDNCFEAVERDETGKITGTAIVQRHSGLRKIFRCGTACLLIKRHVFERLTKPYFFFNFNDDGTQHVRSEDIRFCDMVREAGFEIWADSDVICRHCKEITF